MKSKALLRRALLPGALAVAVAALALPAAAQAHGRQMYAIEDDGNLVSFFEKRPEKIQMQKPITGLPLGVNLVGIDLRPKNGDLYGVGTDSRVYRINPRTAIALAVDDATGNGFGDPPPAGDPLDGSDFGVDFNPVPDRIRVVSDANQNLRVNPDTGQLTASDGDLGPNDPNIVDVAYANSDFSFVQPVAGTAPIRYVDSVSNSLLTAADPNLPVLTQIGSLGINVRDTGGFDIAGRKDVGYLANTSPNGTSRLYRVNINTGAATRVGQIGRKALGVTGLAVVQDQL
jgi:Domain of unknown function (DUF4394)